MYQVIHKEEKTIFGEFAWLEDADKFFRTFRASNKRIPSQLIKILPSSLKVPDYKNYRVLVSYVPE